MLLVLLPLVQAQDARLLKSVEPDYGKYDADLATDFDTVTASVTMTVQANGMPFSLDKSSLPLPMAVVMSLKEYEFRPQTSIPHGRTDTIDAGSYQVTLNVPIRQSKNAVREDPSTIRVNPGVSKGLLLNQVRPVLSEYIRNNRIRGTVTLEAAIGKQGEVTHLRASGGTFVLIEAAYDAVKQWQYRPYLLNREPVAVLSDIQVSFQ